MLAGIEAFCAAHEHTISALEAISTFSAIVVSLWLAHRATVADRTRLVATLQIATLFHPMISPKPRFVVASITNAGNLPLQVPLGFFRWHVPTRRREWLILPVDSAGIPGVLPQKSYPFEIKPRTSETFYLSEVTAFLGQMSGIKSEQNFLGKKLFFFKKAVISSTDGRKFRAKGDRMITAAAAEPGA
jgi:hypothetical protein